jgi:predicted kinase
LHAPDPRVPLATSVRALAGLKRDGLIDSIGLSNVTVGQIEEARRIAEIDSIQVELSIWRDKQFLSGVVEYCISNRLQLLAYRPLGGRKSLSRTANDPTLRAIAERHGATPFEIALAWLYDLAEVIVPLPGATRVETAQSAARARNVALSDDDRARLDALCPAGRTLRRGAQSRVSAPVRTDAEIVLVMGLPGAGKTTLAHELAAQGYTRINRDDAGGTLRELMPALDAALASGTAHIVLDNTYVSRTSRAAVIQAAAERGVAVRCVWLTTTVEDAQVNAVVRLLQRYGKLLDEGELAARRKHDVTGLPPSVQFRYQRELEPPDICEGFSRIDRVPFARRIDPTHVNRAVIVWCDGSVDLNRAAVLRRYQEQGYRLLGMSWQPAIGDGTRTAADVDAIFASMNEQMGLTIEVEYCPHPAGPPKCWCRKPLPGLGVLFIERHNLDPEQCIYVGDGPQDPTFARRLKFQYRPAHDFFRT